MGVGESGGSLALSGIVQASGEGAFKLLACEDFVGENRWVGEPVFPG